MMRALRLGLLLGSEDVREQYRRSFVGPLWITLGLALQVATIGVVFSLIFSVAISDYLPYLAVSLISWNFIQFSLNESSNAFIQAERLIKQIPLPSMTHIFRVSWKNVLVLGHTVLVVPVVFAIFGYLPRWPVLLAPFGLTLVIVNLVWLGTLFAVFSARFRDVPPIIQSLLTMVFYVTPIIWFPDAIPEEYRGLVLGLNPVYHLIEMVRSPLLGTIPSATSIAVCVVAALVGTAIAQVVLRRYRSRIAFWV